MRNFAFEVGRHRAVIRFGEAKTVEVEGRCLMAHEQSRDGRSRITGKMFSSSRPQGDRQTRRG